MSTIDSKCVPQRRCTTHINLDIASRTLDLLLDRLNPVGLRPYSFSIAGSANFCRPRS